MECPNCGSEDLYEVNSDTVGSVVVCRKCKCRTIVGASGRPPVQHPKAPSPEQIAKEAKAKVEKNKREGKDELGNPKNTKDGK